MHYGVPMKNIEEFFGELDQGWKGKAKDKIVLCVIGCSSLLLQTGYARGTKDSDILETSAITPQVNHELLRLGGKNTKLHKKYRMYIDIVAEALPFLPAKPYIDNLHTVERNLFIVGETTIELPRWLVEAT